MVNTVNGLPTVHAVNHVVQVLRQEQEFVIILHLLTVDLHVLDHPQVVAVVTLSYVLVSSSLLV